MSDFEKDLRDELRRANGGDYDPRREETLRGMLLSTFRGRTWWMSLVAWIYILLFTGLAVFAAVRFFQVEGDRQMLLYATVFVAAIIIAAITKIWYWMLINRNAVQREVKRLEIRIAELAEKLSQE
jgi:hypothetical protein